VSGRSRQPNGEQPLFEPQTFADFFLALFHYRINDYSHLIHLVIQGESQATHT
jgi:hypothetical protein